MLIADEKTRDYLQLPAALAQLLKEPDFVTSLVKAPDLDTLYERLFAGFGGVAARALRAVVSAGPSVAPVIGKSAVSTSLVGGRAAEADPVTKTAAQPLSTRLPATAPATEAATAHRRRCGDGDEDMGSRSIGPTRGRALHQLRQLLEPAV